MPKAPPDLEERRDLVVRAAREIAEADGWPAVTMRRLAGALGVTQPVVYTVVSGRQALVDAVAVDGFGELAAALEAVDPTPRARMRAYLDFAAGRPRLYEAMFSLPSELPFAAEGRGDELRRAFAALEAAFPDPEGVRPEVAWAALHGLATLGGSGRLRPGEAEARFELAHALLAAG